MLFKFLHKEEEQENNVSEDELNREIVRKIKRFNWKQKSKKVLIWLVVILGLVGGFKSLMQVESLNVSADAENQMFVKTYALNYFQYPTEDSKKYLDKFTLDPLWRCEFDIDLERSKLSNPEIYKTKLRDAQKNIVSYYMYGELATKMKEENEVKNRIYFRIDVAKSGSSFLVVKPVFHNEVAISSVQDEEKRKEYVLQTNETSQSLKEDEMQEVRKTLELFVKTYNDNPEQAKLLTSNRKIIEALDKNVVVTLDSISSATQDDETIYVKVKMSEAYLNAYKVQKNYYFEMDKEKQKIKKMEVY